MKSIIRFWLPILGACLLSFPLTAQSTLWTVDTLEEARGEIAITGFRDEVWFYGGDRQTGAPSTVLSIFGPREQPFTTIRPGFASTPSPAMQSSEDYVFFYGEGFTLSNFGIYDATTDEFRRESFPNSRFGIDPLLVDDKIYVAGGRGVSIGAPLNAIEVYDIPTDQWSVVADTLSIGRQEAQAILVGNSIYFVGGYTNVNFNRLSARVDVFDLATQTVTASFDMSIPRFKVGLFAVGDKIVVAGGMRSNTFQYTNIIDVIDTQTNTITSTTLGSPDLNMVGAAVENELFLMGDVGTEIDVLDLNTLAVRQIDSGVAGGNSSGKSAVEASGRVYFTLGDFSPSSEVVVYDANFARLDNYDTGTEQVGMRVGTFGPAVPGPTVFVTSGYDRGDRVAFDEVYIYDRAPVVSTRNTTVGPPLRIFPNPATTSVVFQLEDWQHSPVTVGLYDATGRLVYRDVLAANTPTYTLPLVGLKAGIYQVILSDGQRASVGRLLKM